MIFSKETSLCSALSSLAFDTFTKRNTIRSGTMQDIYSPQLRLLGYLSIRSFGTLKETEKNYSFSSFLTTASL
jgi:hypothetical protein